jgi:hypothetical protein
VILLEGGKLSAARARNAGWQAASAPFILFLDGDTILDPQFVPRALVEFDNPRVMVVSGRRREIHPEASIYNRVLDLDWTFPPGFTDYCGGDAMMRREALEQVGGFDARLIAGEEPDLCRRIRARNGLILQIDAPMTGHDLAMVSWRQYWRRAVRTGHAYAEIAAAYWHTSDPLWKDVSRDNAIRGAGYLATPCAMLLISLFTKSWLPVLLLLCGAALVVLRTALRAKPRCASLPTLFFYAIHSHVQHAPIFVGQVSHWLNAWQARQSELIEYKNS